MLKIIVESKILRRRGLAKQMARNNNMIVKEEKAGRITEMVLRNTLEDLR